MNYFLLLLLLNGVMAAQTPPPDAPALDANAATSDCLAQIPADKKAQSDAYFEGGYWLTLWDYLYGAGISLLLLSTRLSARMRSLAARITRFRPLQTGVYFAQYLLAASLLGFPLTVYEGFFREHQYGLATQSFGPWLGDQAKAFAVTLVFGGLAVVALFGVMRRLPRTWHIWGGILALTLIAIGVVLAPVFILPLFNRYTKLSDPAIRDPILRLARANGIPAAEVYEVDASRQSTRISANVSGFLGTERISLNDNLLKRCSPQEIMAALGHEMGHYVLNHVYKQLLVFLVVITVFFAGLRRALDWALARWGGRWEIHGVSDEGILPLALLVISTFGFLYTPIGNTVSRTLEYEADMYGLNAVREPDAFATLSLKLADYRKLSPGPVEEWIFYDHPSGRTRIFTAMRWKVESLGR